MIEAMQLEPLRARKVQIDKRMSDLDNRAGKIAREREELQRESQNIATTLETLAKVYGIELTDEPAIKAGKVTGGASTKPDDAPTLFEMVTIVLEEWSIIDDLVEAQIIYDEIKKRWWRDAPRNSIIPSLWRFAQEDRLIKEGTKYGLLPKDETPGVQPPDVSSFEADLDDEIPF